MNSLLVLVALVATAWATYPDDSALYEDMLVQDLYKRLSELADPAAAAAAVGGGGGYQYDDEVGINSNPYAQQRNWMDDIALESRESGQADLRDHEYLQHSSNSDGFQYISGGAGEGKQHLKPTGTQDNMQEVKSDEGLPFYCHPPNPCPKGYTAEDGCHDFTEDTAEFQQEWILKMQRKGMCACDEEHMFRCPQADKAVEDESNDLDEVLNEILEHADDKEKNPFINKEDKREFLVAKKSPIVKRSIDDIDRYLDQMKEEQRSKRFNPYLDGAHQQIKRVAKKG